VNIGVRAAHFRIRKRGNNMPRTPIMTKVVEQPKKKVAKKTTKKAKKE